MFGLENRFLTGAQLAVLACAGQGQRMRGAAKPPFLPMPSRVLPLCIASRVQGLDLFLPMPSRALLRGAASRVGLAF